MQYLLLPHINEAKWQNLTQAEQRQKSAAFIPYGEALTKAGVLISAYRPQPSSSTTTIRSSNGKTQIQDGPHVDTEMHISGLYIIDVPDHEAALTWAKRCPAMDYGVIEVRPVWERPS